MAKHRKELSSFEFTLLNNETGFDFDNKSESTRKEKISNKMAEFNENALNYYSCLQRVKQYVETHHSEHIPLKTAARIAGMETKYFSAFFHRKTGVTYTRWLTSLRIARAMVLIRGADA